MRGRQMGGIVDRQGRRHIIFDIDGTREAIRQRALVDGPERPSAHRRAEELAAPGYTGRKRGEVVRSRWVVQQAHSHEWLGTFGEAGNGERWPRVRSTVERIRAYMCHRALAPNDAIVRSDGELGWAHGPLQCLELGVGYLMRGVDYRLLDSPLVTAALATAPQRFKQTDTGTDREVYDVGWVRWTSVVDENQAISTRLIVTRMRASGDPATKPKIGKRISDWVYELFVTDRRAEAFTGVDVVSMYFARGGFEQTLSEEDLELDPDRWFSGAPHGQELAQILAQWTWNKRLQLGLVVTPCEPRVTLWSEALPSVETTPARADEEAVAREPIEAPVPPTSTDRHAPVSTDAVTAAPIAEPMRAEVIDSSDEATSGTSEAPAPLTPTCAKAAVTVEGASTAMTITTPELPTQRGFSLQPDGTLRCPENKTLRRAEVRGAQVRFRARNSDCHGCPRAVQCLGAAASGRRGRRVTWLAADLVPHPSVRAERELTAGSEPVVSGAPARFAPPPLAGPEPLYWHDLPATSLRRGLPASLRQQRIDGLQTACAPPRPAPILDRDRRAHRRLTWRARLMRNARPASAPLPHLRLYGVPDKLAAYLGIDDRA